MGSRVDGDGVRMGSEQRLAELHEAVRVLAEDWDHAALGHT